MSDTSSAAPSQHRTIGPEDILRHMEVESGLYALGCFERRVTLLSQQVRALNLVYALCEQRLLQRGARVCVIGGGAAGMTAAAAAARRGCRVVLLEQRSDLLPLFHGNHSRWLHPYVYDWPQEHLGRPEGVHPDDAALPLLSWKADLAGNVALQLEQAWKALPEREHIKVIPNVRSIQLGELQGQTRSVSWNAPGFDQEDFEVVVLAVGFGLEREVEGIEWLSYWRDEQLHQEVVDGRKRHLISGCGDGGLVDLLRLRLRRFRHETIVEELLSSPSLDEVKRQLIEIEHEALDARKRAGEAASSKLLTKRYRELKVPNDFQEAFKARLRPDTEAVLNGLGQWPLTLQASILNRFLVSRLLLGSVGYRWGEFKHKRKDDGSYEVKFDSGPPEHFHRIICRWGANPAAELAFPKLKEQFNKLRSRNELDQTRWRVWPRGYFGPEPGGEGPGSTRSGSAPVQTTSAPRPSAAPFFGVPTESLGQGYKGRAEDLKKLHDLLRGSESVVLTGTRMGKVFAHGGGGIGKSRLSIEYAWRYQQDSPGGIFFAVVNERSPMVVWAEFARKLFQKDLPKDDEAALEFVRWLEDPAPGQRLLILDDVQAASPAELNERFARKVEGGQVIWPLAARYVSLLVTTRMREFPGAVGFEVHQLDAAAALELLLERAGRTALAAAERALAAELASKVLGGHPLALTLAGAYVRRLGLSLTEYKEALTQKGLTDRLEAAAREVGYQVEDHERSIVATYELSRRQLDTQSPVDALAQRVLNVAAFLAPNVPIDRKLLLRLLARQGKAVSAEELGQALARLVNDLSLLNSASEEQGWTGDVMIHPLVADYTRGSIEQDEREPSKIALLGAMTELFPEGGPPAYWHVARPDAHPDWEWLSPERVSHTLEIWKAIKGDDSRERGFLATRLGDLYVFRANLTNARDFYRSAIDVCERLVQSDPSHAEWQRDLCVSYERLGGVLVAQGDLPSARRAFEQALAIAERLAQSDPGHAEWQRDLSVSYNKLGGVLEAQGDFPSARRAFEQSLAIRQRLAQSDPGHAEWQRDLSVSYNNLGGVLVAQGDSPLARQAFEQALAIAERLAQSDPGHAEWQRNLSVSYNKLGGVLEAQGDFPSARRAFEQNLSIAERLAQSDPGNAQWQRDLSVSYERLGDVLVAQGDLPSARRAFEQDLAIAERLAQSDPGNVIWQTDFVYSALQVARQISRETDAERLRGRTLLMRAKDILTRLAAESRLSHKQSALIPAVDELLREFSD